jgi:hypothetical protein
LGEGSGVREVKTHKIPGLFNATALPLTISQGERGLMGLALSHFSKGNKRIISAKKAEK